MIKIQEGVASLYGPAGSLAVREDDEITLKLAMLVEGQCEGLGSTNRCSGCSDHALLGKLSSLWHSEKENWKSRNTRFQPGKDDS